MSRILCDYYAKGEKQLFGDDPNAAFNVKIKAFNNMLGWLYDAGILAKVSFEFKDMANGVEFALDVKDLLPYRSAMENSGVEGAALASRHIFDEEYTPCIYSGVIQIGWPMNTYRNVDGCVGSSWESDLIKGLNTEAIYEVDKVRNEQGIRAGVNKLFSFYIWNTIEAEKKPALDNVIRDAESKSAVKDAGTGKEPAAEHDI